MASYGTNTPQTTTFTETVPAGEHGNLTAGDWVNDTGHQVFLGTATPDGTTNEYLQSASKKCLLQLDLVENDNNTTLTTTGSPIDELKQVPELVRRCVASQAAQTGGNTGKSNIKSVYVRVEYYGSANDNS